MDLFESIRKGNIKHIRELIREGTDVNYTKRDGWTPLHLASNRGLLEIVQILLLYGANVNAKSNKGETPLYFATVNDYPEIVELLLQYSSNPNIPDNINQTPLHKASEYGLIEIIELLLEAGADPTIKDDILHKTPIYLSKDNQTQDVFDEFLKKQSLETFLMGSVDRESTVGRELFGSELYDKQLIRYVLAEYL